MTTATESIPTSKCFVISVDGKQFGPFLDRHRAKVEYLAHRKGIDIATIWLKEGWIIFTPPLPRRKRDKTTPLLEGVNMVPVYCGKKEARGM